MDRVKRMDTAEERIGKLEDKSKKHYPEFS